MTINVLLINYDLTTATKTFATRNKKRQFGWSTDYYLPGLLLPVSHNEITGYAPLKLTELF